MTFKLKLMLLSITLIVSCQNNKKENTMDVIAHKDGYTLTKTHADIYVSMLTSFNTQANEKDKMNYRKLLLDDFYENPKETLKMINEHIEMNPHLQNKNSQKENLISEEIRSEANNKQSGLQPNLAYGFKEFRKIIKKSNEKNYKESYFNNKEANTLRNFLSNNQLYYKSVSNYGGGGTTFIEKLIFCADGTFSYSKSSGIVGSVPGVSGNSRSNNMVTGFWEAIYGDGMYFINVYSNHPEFTQYNPYGFIPMQLKSYQNDVVIVQTDAEDKFYRRTIIQCN